MDLAIREQVIGEQLHLYVSGEVDTYTAPKLKEVLHPAISEQDVVVHLEEVEYMDSTGLGVFVGALKIATRNEKELSLVGVTDRVNRLFELTGLHKLLSINSNVRGGTQ
ncbi:STAS domain-containing protein [Exiguobacterium profundum]|uniref:Anti-sigma factor antagonist n=1 Tax=Exiguobacterium profundum TaxID=307643 RepID=A0ABY8AZB0_9BACL|nr:MULTISPECIES: STAS domain-containing protein [Exiguobacterium]MCM3281609.1 STAS domain-containing protein [Exiguobacterium sp. MER 193]WED55010.1 STAS domain-containing protein [Exiguobacterium profundum]